MAAMLAMSLLTPGCSKPSGPSQSKLAELEAAAQRAEETPTPPGEEKKSAEPQSKPKTGREVLERMVGAYRKASTYADAGTVRLLAEAGEQKIDETANFSADAGTPEQDSPAGLSGDGGLRRQEAFMPPSSICPARCWSSRPRAR